MNRFWNHNVGIRYITFLVSMILIIVLFCWNLIFNHFFQKLNEENFLLAASLLEDIRQEYPDFDEEGWIEKLNRYQKDSPYGQELLNQYGIFQGNGFSAAQEGYQMKLAVLGSFLLAGACLFIFAGMVFYFCRRQKKIDEMVAYIREVEKGKYQLELQENQEDELSSLQNELYKITVALKESAELSGKQKKALADSVSDISHQLKTPLTSVMVLLDNLSESGNMDEGTRRRFLSEVTRQMTNINWLVAALLKLSRLDAGVVEFERGAVSLEQLFKKVSENLELQAEWKQIQIIREVEGDIFIEGDAGWIEEALTNIVKNAIEHSPECSQVLLHAEENAVYTSVSVRDWGEGISEEDQKHIFERFYRSRSAGENSVGIGLSLAKEIVEKQNGYLTMTSDPQNGTEFMMKFLKV